MKYFEPLPQEESMLVLQALKICKVLKYEQLEKLLFENGVYNAHRILKAMINKQLIEVKGNNNVSMLNVKKEIDSEITAAFWVFLKWASKINNRFSSAEYPAQIMFTNNEKNFEIVVCSGNGLNEIGHIMGRKKPFLETKYIVVFLDPNMYENLDKTKLEDYDFLFATLTYENGKPNIVYHNQSKQE